MVRMTETMGKLRNAHEQGDGYGVLAGGRLLATSAAMLLGLLNRQYYPSARGLYELSKAMPIRPDNYYTLLDRAGGFTTHDPGEVHSASLELWEGLQGLARARGVEWETGELEI
jgi:kanamycin nucleotidyltransferase